MVVRQKLRRRLSDPWGWVVAAACGGLGWATLAGTAPTGVPVVAGAAIGATVLGVATLYPSRVRPRLSLARTDDRLPTALPGSPEEALLTRAASATARIEVLADAPGDAWLRGEMQRVVSEARAARASLDETAGRVALVTESVAQTDISSLEKSARRLRASLEGGAEPGLDVDTRAALAAVEEQQDLARRLATLRESLLRRMETAVIGLETLSARTSEIVALGSSAYAHHEASGRISAMADELEALRTGLDEAGRVT